MKDPPARASAGAHDPSVERYDRLRHESTYFSCGNPDLDSYLIERLDREEADRAAVAYVLVARSEPETARLVIGYFTLNSFALPKKQARRRGQDKILLSYSSVPAVLIGRLAVDRTHKGAGLGSVLIAAALRRILDLSEALGIAAIVVHAIDEGAARFYEHQGFTPFRDEPSHLYYAVATFERALRDAT